MGMDRILERLKAGEGPPLRVSELAEVIGCSRSHLHKLIDAGALHAGRVGTHYTIPLREARSLAKKAGVLAEAESKAG